MKISDAVAVVTGASRGIGRTISEQLIDRGATVFGLARSEADLQSIREKQGEAFYPVRCDIRKREEVEDAIQTVKDEAGRLDILVNNAGLGRWKPVDELSPEDWNVQIDTNLSGVFHCTRAAVPVMKQQNDGQGFAGHIVNIVSIAGLVGNTNLSAYNASKFGVTGFTEAIMKELRGDGIKVTAIYPGSTHSSFSDAAGHTSASNPMEAEDVAQTVLHVLDTPTNYLISEVVMRPLRPRG